MKNINRISKNDKISKNNKLSKYPKRRPLWKSALAYTTFTLVFTAVAAPFTLLYGPFETAKKIYVGSAMKTMSHQWLATMFLSQDRIDKLLKSDDKQGDTTSDSTAQDSSLIKISQKRDASIEEKEIQDENNKFKGYALIVSDPTRVKIGVSTTLGTSGETVSQIAENYGAEAAINGGYFTDEKGAEKWTSNGGIASGFLMSEGKVKNNSAPNTKGPILSITKEGKLLISDTTPTALLSKKKDDKNTITEAMSYVTTLVKNGKPVTIAKDEGSAPKTMIGQRTDGSMVLVVLDSSLPGGRICATLEEARKVMLDLNCYTAVNLDGGKSTTMYYKGEVINNPSYALGERPISSGFVVK
ncbi:phosphodiester glycosidase family protein [Clostridium sp. SHJSY1]|uniref:phosphodiester glycosidase family protein n=1 Tax=Clostridium sp. SHJSY1 TaxID=2942483 RepID=UPI002875F2B3|nr:phosphodiester glycosidase family protein [Clostridium sp. SHJSY1]MDS0527900.1 phosphodiester glycosidase family protein [Clostridium sp. SHJSY1]